MIVNNFNNLVKIMKNAVLITLIQLGVSAFWAFTADAATRVRGYYKPRSGTYVMPHYRSSPNSTRWDNYSSRGNYNPFTGKKGYSSPYKSYRFR